MKRKVFTILIIAIIAAAFCQLGVVLTCIRDGSVMHMPTLKSTAMVFAVSLAMTVGIDLLLDVIVTYSGRTAAWISVAALFLIVVVIQSLLNPIVSKDGRILYRYPMLAAIGLAVLISELITRGKKPDFSKLIVKPDFAKPETVFTVILVLLGTVMSLMLPRDTQTGIDDDSHYKNTLFFSEGFYSSFDDYESELLYSWDPYKTEENHLDDVYIKTDLFAFSPARVGYMGPAIGVWFGRALNLSVRGQYFFGRLGGLLIYSVIIYYAIKHLKNGKLLMGLVALAPVSVQLSICYSYDAWLLAFTLLGFSYFFGAIQRPESKLTFRDCLIMIGSIFIGTWVKMPYAVLLLILLLMPKNKFSSSKQHRHYCEAVIACILFEFIFTMMTSFGLGEVADYRGGSDVSGTGQIAFIMSNPGTYIKMLTEFAIDYVKPLFSDRYLSDFNYFGTTNAFYILWAAMVIFTLIDNEISLKGYLSRTVGLVILLLAVVVIATSMYLSFTPVASPTINGVQLRYKLHLVFPCFMFLFSGWIVNPKLRTQKTNMACYAVSAGCLIYNMVALL